MDDIVTQLRARESDTNCWQCGEYGCLPADCNYWTRKPAPCVCAEHRRPPDPDGFVCACNCHEPSPLMLEAADEIERLRALIDDLLPVWEPCRYDHDGYCQAHYLHERPCPVQSLKELRNG